MKDKYPGILDLLAIVFVFLVTSVIGSVIAGACMLFFNLSQTEMMAIGYPIPMVATIFFAIWMRRMRERITQSYEGDAPLTLRVQGNWLPLLLQGLVLMTAVSVVLEPLLMLFPEKWFEALEKLIGTGVWAIVTTVVMAPILEEALFRGVIQDAAVKRYGAVGGIFISAAVFGVIHLVPMQVINAFAVGIVLGYVFYMTRSLLPVIIMHAFNNGLSYVLTHVVTTPDGGKVRTLADAIGSQPLYWAIYVVAVGVMVVGGLYMWQEVKKKERPA